MPSSVWLLAALSLVPTCPTCSRVPVPDVPHIASFFGTKTRYEDVNQRLRQDVLSVNTSALKPPRGERCSPIHLTAVIRHGRRYPTASNIRRIRQLNEMVRAESPGGPVRTDLREAVRTGWDMWYTDDMDGECGQ